MKPELIVIVGPTAVGKTGLAIRVAEALGCEIVSADSRQVYREMRIGTAAPTDEELARVPHHMVRCRSVRDPLNAYGFEQEVLKLLPGAFARGGGRAVLAGGSLMYVDAVCRGIDEMPDIPPPLRAELKNQLEAHGLEAIVERLRLLDPDYCAAADLKNPRRVLHALELCLVSGQTVSSLRRSIVRERPFHIRKFAVLRPREELYARIGLRVDQMMEAGLLAEARSLLPFHGLSPLDTVGYRELFAHLRGEADLAEAVRLIKRNTRHYAKKQLTWINSDGGYIPLNPEDAEEKIISLLQNQNQSHNFASSSSDVSADSSNG